MSYSYPAFDAVDASFEGAGEYTRPAFDAVDAEWVPPEEVLTRVAVATMLGSTQVLSDVPPAAVAWVSSSFGDAAVSAFAEVAGIVSVPSPLSPRVIVFHDYSVAIPEAAVSYYHADFITPDGRYRVPISSWQATLQTGVESYVQCVIPAVSQWVDILRDATSFEIVREVSITGGTTIEQVMASAPAQTLSLAQGSFNYTATVSGYSDPYEEEEDPDAVYDRTLRGVQTIFTNPNSLRVRASIDWLLRPGKRAIVNNETTITVAYINYFVGGGQAFMDVGNRSTG